MSTKRISATVLGLTLSALTGCGSGPVLVPVSGTVTQNGEPLADAAVAFLPLGEDSTLTAEAMTGPDGQYTLSTRGSGGVAVGKYKVAVTKIPPPPPGMDPAIAADPYMASMANQGQARKKGAKGGPVEAVFENVEVVGGKNDPIDFDVKVAVEAAKP